MLIRFCWYGSLTISGWRRQGAPKFDTDRLGNVRGVIELFAYLKTNQFISDRPARGMRGTSFQKYESYGGPKNVQLPATYYMLPTTYCLLPFTYYLQATTYCQLLTTC